MTQHKFKPGDRVRCIEPTGVLRKGRIYTIAGPAWCGNFPTYELKEHPYYEFYETRFELVEGEPMQHKFESIEATQDELAVMRKIASRTFTYADLLNAKSAITRIVDALQAGKSVLPPSDPWYQDNYGRWCRRNV